jgi:heptosyltransferase-2
MNVLIIKLNATGDVVRTTPFLRCLEGEVTWVTASNNLVLLEGVAEHLQCVAWDHRAQVADRRYDLVINLEDEIEAAIFVKELASRRIYGAYLDGENRVRYTDDSRAWFDMSLISAHGKVRADELKFQNRRSYQDLVFEGLGLRFEGQGYLLPTAAETALTGDVALAPVAGPVWPMKNWAHYADLKASLESRGLRVNVLPRRASLLEHLGDVKNHRCLVGGDSLPMHLALGAGIPCVTIFNCTSPWEIHDYGLQTKIVSPLLAEFFYERGADVRATTAIGMDVVLNAVMERLAT